MTRFETACYERSHAKAPRGTGCWAFATEERAQTEPMFFSPCMTFGEAKKWVKAEAARQGNTATTFFVQP